MKNPDIENGILHLAANDNLLAGIINKVGGCRLKPHKNYYNSLLEAIIGQQLSMKAADSIINKFMSYFSGAPSPELIVETDDEILRSLGLSFAKIKYVKDLSQKVIDREVTFRNINRMSDDEIIAELTKVKGIGVWTVHMFLIFTLCRLNVLPVGDLGIKKAVMLTYGLKVLPDEKMVKKISGKYNWTPYNTLASWYLWKSLEIP